MKKGIIFDMDGTLWDSAESVAASWNEVLIERGVERAPLTIEDFRGVMGRTMDVIADTFFPGMETEQRRELLEECCRRENRYLGEHGAYLYPGVVETLHILKEIYPLYIVSNCQCGYIECFVRHYGLEDVIADMECFGNNGRSKGENIALVVKRNQLSDAVYVGDIQGDYDASMEAGVRFIHAAYGFGTIQEPVSAIREFGQLVQAVEKLW